MNTQPLESRDLTALARERVQMGPPPEWIAPCPYSPEFQPQARRPLTYLLLEEQVHAELHQRYVRTAVRLETAQAVQHQSQWRLQFEPQTQRLTLHSIQLRRGTQVTEHVRLDRLQFLRREAGLEGCMVDGWITLLLVLEDVCPGDVLEWSYTLTAQSRLLPEGVDCWFALPPGAEVGKYHFSLRHAEGRAVQWKASAPQWQPVHQPDGSGVRYFWQGERVTSPEPEECTPTWQQVQPWIQVSDCPDWQTFARAVVAAWKTDSAGDGLTRLVEEIKAPGGELPAQVTRAIESVQDRFRYLAMDLDPSGQIPADAETVIRRRYGDCKDLAFLLVRVLRQLGVPARPVLVHTAWRHTIGTRLPSAAAFNHAIVEFQLGNETRWVDATVQGQGGGALRRWVSDFGLGLPIDEATTELMSVPKASLPTASYEVKETLLLDTTGRPSCLSVLATARGLAADILRWELLSRGSELVARQRQQACANRFFQAARLGQLQYRDDREANTLVLAEAFEIDGFLKPDRNSNTCLLLLPGDQALSPLLCPSPAPRRYPWALPFPCERVHTIELEFAGLNGASVPAQQEGNEFFSFSRRVKSLPRFLGVTCAFRTRAEVVPPDHVPEHRRRVQAAWQAAALQLQLPLGYAHVRRRTEFGQLPKATRGESASPSPAAPSSAVPPPASAAGPTAELAPAPAPLPARRPLKPRAPSPAPGEPAERAPRPAPAADRSRSGRSRPGQRNKKCQLALFLFLGAAAAMLMSTLLGLTHDLGLANVGGMLLVLAIPPLLASLVLALLGLRECRQHPQRFARGKGAGLFTLILGGACSLVLIPVFLGVVRSTLDGPQPLGMPLPRTGTPLRFDAMNFVFHSPGRPWAQVDARAFPRGTVLALAGPGPIYFNLYADRMTHEFWGPLTRMETFAKTRLRHSSTSFEVLGEHAVTYNGLEGWQVEARLSYQGQERYLVHWLCVTNQFAYQHVLWGPPSARARINTEADRLFRLFESVGASK